MIHVLALSYLLHPLGICAGTKVQVRDCLGYNFWSGIGSDLGELTLVTMLLGAGAAWWHHHNCHRQGCWRLHWHPDPETGHPVCKRHHPDPHGYLDGTAP